MREARYYQDEALVESLEDPDSFWAHQAKQLFWHQKPDTILRMGQKRLLNGTMQPTWDWFSGGQISTCYNCIHRHVLAGNGEYVAIYYDSPVTDTKEKYTYSRLLFEVETLAGALREKGVRKGDVVMLYMPMIPGALVGMLAVNLLGAVHSVVFGGFAPLALAQRIDACKPVLLLTASCSIIGNRKPIAYQPLVEEALRLCTHKPRLTVIWQREQLIWKLEARDKTDFGKKPSCWTAFPSWLKRVFIRAPVTTSSQILWQDMVGSARQRGVKADCVPVSSSDPVYILYTSGTTGAPKGVLREAGGNAVGLNLSIRSVFGIQGPGDVSLTTSDIGWVVGHSYILYGPLLAGASTVLYEGKPVGTPDAGAFWRMVEEYKVNTMFTAPTALRAIKNEDPDNKAFEAVGARGGLRSLKALFIAGERSEHTLITTYQSLLQKYAASSAQVVDNWWSTEVGSPITGRALMPQIAMKDFYAAESQTCSTLLSKPGSAGKPMPGFSVHVVDDEGQEVSQGTMGDIVLKLPLAPTAFHTLWQSDLGFYQSYLERYNGKFLETGDSGWIDEDGYVFVMGRNDDVLNVSAYRLSSGSLEQAIASHPLVVETCVVGIPDKLKGQLPFAFVTLSLANAASNTIALSEIDSLVREQVGAFASLGGIICGKGMIPKTRSGKTLRRVLRQLLENAVDGEFDKEVSVPNTIEDGAVVDVARVKVREYFAGRKGVEGYENEVLPVKKVIGH